jgi:hypothetical protein
MAGLLKKICINRTYVSEARHVIQQRSVRLLYGFTIFSLVCARCVFADIIYASSGIDVHSFGVQINTS